MKTPDEVTVKSVWKRIRRGCLPVMNSITGYYHPIASIDGGAPWFCTQVRPSDVMFRKTVRDWKPATHFIEIPPPDGSGGKGRATLKQRKRTSGS